MSIPKSVTDTIAALKAERGPLAARLDAIDLAIDNLSRVYGLHGTPQPLPLTVERRTKERRKPVTKPRAVASATPEKGNSAAAERRDLILALIEKSDVGLTLAEIRKQTAKMDDKDRGNAIQGLRMQEKIRRAGNAWVKAA